MQSFTPQFFITLKYYNKELFYKDLAAGILVGIISVPLSIALAVSSGVSPNFGINTAIIAGFLISFLGGSNVQISGPATAFVPVIFSISNKYGTDGLIIATIMAGILLIFMGLCKLGTMIKLVPYTLITGFTTGIAVSVLLKQHKELLGLTLTKTPTNNIEVIIEYIHSIGSINIATCCIGILSIIIISSNFPKQITKYVPSSLIAIIIGSCIVHFLNLTSVTTVGSIYQDLNIKFFHFAMPSLLDIEIIKNLTEPALSIAIFAGIEALLSATMADGMIGTSHKPNVELIAQGSANILSAFLGGMPATAAIARTATTIKNGGRTPIAGIIHAITILIIMLLFMTLAKKIPLACLSAILIVVAYNMGKWSVFRKIYRAPKNDTSLFLTAFITTVTLGTTNAIKIGLLFTGFLFIRNITIKISDLIHTYKNGILKEISTSHNENVNIGQKAWN